jgi:ATP-binding cassette subfamily B (MDR/TAP) protein 1
LPSVFFSVLLVVAVLGTIAAPIMAITKAISVSSTFFSMIDSEVVSYDGLDEAEVSPHEDIEFKNVSFSYPTRANVQVLKSFDAIFLKGKTNALVGPSGSGKSTIVALLERWYEVTEEAKIQDEATAVDAATDTTIATDSGEKAEAAQPENIIPNQGTISVGGTDITATKLKWWRSQIGLVQQEPFLFNDTIFRNVAFGLLGTKWEHSDERVTREKVEKACEEAFADEFIIQLPDVTTYIQLF